METTVLKIADSFSRYPAGRVSTDGPYSGQKFRTEFLEPVLVKHQHLVIDLNGTRGYGSSFLEEAFGGLVRKGFKADEVLKAFEFKARDGSLVLEIKEYIKDAQHT